MASDFKHNDVPVLLHQVLKALLIVVFKPIRDEYFIPPAGRLIDVHRGEELFLWACILQLLLKPGELSLLLILCVLLVLRVERKAIESKKGELARDQVGAVPSATLECLIDLR